MRVRAVCLDVDDTLVDFGGAALAALEHVLGGPTDGALWHQVTEHHYGRYLAGEVDFPTMQLDRLAGVYAATGRALPVDLAGVDARRMVELRARLRLFDDVADCLAALRGDGLRVAVVSNSDGPHQRAKLAAAGLGDAFDAVVVSGEVGVAKPAAQAGGRDLPARVRRARGRPGRGRARGRQARHRRPRCPGRRAARGVAGPVRDRWSAARGCAPGARARRGCPARATTGRLSEAIGGRPASCVTLFPGRRARPVSRRTGEGVESHWGMV